MTGRQQRACTHVRIDMDMDIDMLHVDVHGSGSQPSPCSGPLSCLSLNAHGTKEKVAARVGVVRRRIRRPPCSHHVIGKSMQTNAYTCDMRLMAELRPNLGESLETE